MALSKSPLAWGVLALFLGTAGSTVATAGRTSAQGNDWIIPDELLVKFNDKTTETRRRDVRSRFHGHLNRRMRVTGIEHWSLPPGSDLNTVISQLEASGVVKYAEPNYRLQRRLRPNDSDFGLQWAMESTGGQSAPTFDLDGQFTTVGSVVGADMNMLDAWELTTGSRNVVIAIHDDGIDLDHPDLAANLWVNPDEIANNGIDDDQNGYIDDINGWDVINNDNIPDGDKTADGHGTIVAGAAGGVGNNGTGTSGAAWNVSLMAVRAGTDTAQAVAGIEYAIAAKADILNASWGGPEKSSALGDAIDAMEKAGMLLVVASGNNVQDNDLILDYPSSYPNGNIIVVTASTAEGKSAEWSHWGQTQVDIAAPGEGVYLPLDPATAADYGITLNGSSSSNGDLYGYIDGTSFSAPYTAGVAALIKSYRPNADYKELKARLMAGVVSVGDTWNRLTATNGRIDAHAALTATEAPLVVINGLSITDPNDNTVHALRPNTNYNFNFRLENVWKDATNIQATLSTSDSSISLITDNASYGSLAQGGKGNPTSPFVIKVGSSGITGHVPLELSITADGGYSVTRRFMFYRMGTVLMESNVGSITHDSVSSPESLQLPTNYNLIETRDFTITGLNSGATATITWTLSDFPSGVKVLKCSGANCTTDITSQTTVDPIMNTISYSVTDGGSLDADGTANGQIRDPVVLAENTGSTSTTEDTGSTSDTTSGGITGTSDSGTSDGGGGGGLAMVLLAGVAGLFGRRWRR
jgi:subtilisin family serine protease